MLTHIKQEILANGPISFAHFMEQVLYAPGLGYYSGDRPKFGQFGDFTTAPEFSILYSNCIARQCHQVLENSGEAILEFGAGTGVMAAQILKKLEIDRALPKKYYIMEVSRSLQTKQRETLQHQVPHLIHLVEWLATLEGLVLDGVVIANEVLDAFPIHRFKFQDNQLFELFVDVLDDQCRYVLLKPGQAVEQYIKKLNLPYQEGYESECNLLLFDWVKAVSKVLRKGLCLIIDYGFPRHEYYHSERNQGTLMCHYRHQAHSNPLIHLGEQDITSHIDFTAVAEAAIAANFAVANFTNQAGFLISCGIAEELQKQEENYFQLANQIKVLTSPNEMGELFKVMALTQNIDYPLIGFSLLDIREKLSRIY